VTVTALDDICAHTQPTTLHTQQATTQGSKHHVHPVNACIIIVNSSDHALLQWPIGAENVRHCMLLLLLLLLLLLFLVIVRSLYVSL
jgi:hypothetical protein